MSLFNIGNYHAIPEMYGSLCSVDPDIIALCEDHNTKSHRLANAHLILQNYQEGDAVVVESTEDQPYWHQQVEYLSKIVPLFGWDSEIARKSVDELSYKIHAVLDKIDALDVKINSSDIRPEELFLDVQDILNDIPEKYHFESVKILMSDEQILTYLCRKALPHFLSLIANVYGNREWANIARCDPERNRSLIQRIEEVKKNYKRVFVIAGAAHFVGEEVWGQQLSENIKEVQSYLLSKKFVVLHPILDKEDNEVENFLNQSKTISHSFQWMLRHTSYLMAVPKFLMHSTISWLNNPNPSHWHRHPNSWMERIKKMADRQKGDDDYATLSIEFYHRYKFGMVENSYKGCFKV